ncbi:MAG: nucleotide exchange factor GrpE [Candidatus Levybacteria bacterium CG10_big_fil_rev_8_21_14_0_10_35_13]|nr:MAG: nucleotide exchange factor GrpE [Candidatus Levybacteria bacterium CG10_big_fil_rev_8_21_14_0_10_35_13]
MNKKNKKKVQEKENEELESLGNQLKRALADYQNLEKRITEEKNSWIKSANKDLLLKLLPGLDSLILAEVHTNDEGVKLSIKHFLDALEQVGVKKIETVGKDFDPKVMEAVSTQEVDPSTGSGQREGRVVEELRAGYTLNESVLRPAQVVVGSAKQNSE